MSIGCRLSGRGRSAIARTGRPNPCFFAPRAALRSSNLLPMTRLHPEGRRRLFPRGIATASASRSARRAAVSLALALSPAAALAAAPPGTEGIEQWLERSVALPDGQQLRVEVEIGQLHRGLRLAPCERAEPFIPSGARL